MFNQLKDNKTYYYCDYYGFHDESPAKNSHLFNKACYFMIPYFFKFDFI